MGNTRGSLIKEISCSNLDVNDSFFDSLRDNYGPEFDRWFKEKCVDGGRNAHVIREGENLYGLCIFKVEHNEPINSDGDIPCEIALKICTFKVSDEARGVKFGERLLRSVFEKCYSEVIPFIYLTTGSIQESLIKLLEEFGFHQYGTIKSRGAKSLIAFLASGLHHTMIVIFLIKICLLVSFFRLTRMIQLSESFLSQFSQNGTRNYFPIYQISATRCLGKLCNSKHQKAMQSVKPMFASHL